MEFKALASYRPQQKKIQKVEMRKESEYKTLVGTGEILFSTAETLTAIQSNLKASESLVRAAELAKLHPDLFTKEQVTTAAQKAFEAASMASSIAKNMNKPEQAAKHLRYANSIVSRFKLQAESQHQRLLRVSQLRL